MNKRDNLFRLPSACLLLLVTLAFAVFFISRSRSFQFFGGLVTRADTTEKVVALTFDDGPTDVTPEILQTLSQLDVKATFFLIGNQVEAKPDWARQIANAGHEIGNHSYNHSRMVLKRYGWIADEIERTDALIRDTGYVGQIQFRPPYGKRLLLLPLYLHNHGRQTILWTLEPNSDSQLNADAESIVQNVVDNVTPGAIILLHPMQEKSGETSRAALPGIVEGLRAQGYTFVTVSELLDK